MPPPSYLSLLKDDLVVCRCEEVTVSQLKELLRKGISDMNTLKSLSRIGMGRCQGRNCFATLAAIVAQELGCSPSDLIFPKVRQPLKPICLGDLLKGEIPSAAPPEMKLV
jgi:bacterioferritin-associated ferredoxin